MQQWTQVDNLPFSSLQPDNDVHCVKGTFFSSPFLAHFFVYLLGHKRHQKQDLGGISRLLLFTSFRRHLETIVVPTLKAPTH